MCEPTTLIQIGMAVVSAVAAGKQADAQTKAIEQGYAQQTQALLAQYDQINKSASDELGERARETRIEQARLRAIGAESGLGGASLDRTVNESAHLAGTDMATIEANRVNRLRQAQYGGQANQADTQARLASVSRPSLIGTGLRIANIYQDHRDKQEEASRREQDMRRVVLSTR